MGAGKEQGKDEGIYTIRKMLVCEMFLVPHFSVSIIQRTEQTRSGHLRWYSLFRRLGSLTLKTRTSRLSTDLKDVFSIHEEDDADNANTLTVSFVCQAMRYQ